MDKTPPANPDSAQPSQEEEMPTASSTALQFLQSIGGEDYKYLLFRDDLVTTSDTGRELGEFSVSVEQTIRNGENCFLVHANSHGAIDNVPCGTSITAHVSERLETLEQHHHEYVKLENCPLDRKTVLIKQADNFVVNRVITQGEDVQKSTQSFPVDKMAGFISEGSNLLLHRLMIQKGIPQNFQLLSFDSDSHVCQATYKKLEDRTQVVDGVELKVWGIERTIHSKSDLPTTWQSYFTSDGFLSSRVQVGSPVTMRLARIPQPIVRDEEPTKPIFSKKPLNWEEDLQLFSKFLDRKEELKCDHSSYMRNHPELKALMADFMQFLLLRKPKDVIAFAADYFASFSSAMPTPPSYMSSAVPTPFPQSRASDRMNDLRKN
ncbi:ciliogenesis-associated TTC17-interacting protein-like isoform X2 [Liolophura sinensis]|uniref:ciliogenesis-associated TTC17-interacting protein-like isoform X2 n=1 Tax=Liolophura sinensis TaxID=3198878 RepID=UPI0031586182